MQKAAAIAPYDDALALWWEGLDAVREELCQNDTEEPIAARQCSPQ
jgi:hypothetical protein